MELARGATVKDACRKLAITEHTYYRRVTALLRMEGWLVNHKRVQRSGGAKACRCRGNNPNEPGCGSTMARASGCDHSAKITAGRMTSSITGRTRVELCGC